MLVRNGNQVLESKDKLVGWLQVRLMWKQKVYEVLESFGFWLGINIIRYV